MRLELVGRRPAAQSGPIDVGHDFSAFLTRSQPAIEPVVCLGEQGVDRRAADELKRLTQGRFGRALAFAGQQPLGLAEFLQELILRISPVATFAANDAWQFAGPQTARIAVEPRRNSGYAVQGVQQRLGRQRPQQGVREVRFVVGVGRTGDAR